jgi:hypothetical protein
MADPMPKPITGNTVSWGSSERQAVVTLFSFATLSLRLVFNSPVEIPLAVVVKSRKGVYLVGREPARPEGLTDIGWKAIQELPDTLLRDLTTAYRIYPHMDVLDFLAGQYRGNIHLSEPQVIQIDLPIVEVAFLLFARYLIGEPVETTMQPSRMPLLTWPDREKIYKFALPAPPEI